MAPFPMLQSGVLQHWLQTRRRTRSPISMHPVLQLLEQFLLIPVGASEKKEKDVRREKLVWCWLRTDKRI